MARDINIVLLLFLLGHLLFFVLLLATLYLLGFLLYYYRRRRNSLDILVVNKFPFLPGSISTDEEYYFEFFIDLDYDFDLLFDRFKRKYYLELFQFYEFIVFLWVVLY